MELYVEFVCDANGGCGVVHGVPPVLRHVHGVACLLRAHSHPSTLRCILARRDRTPVLLDPTAYTLHIEVGVVGREKMPLLLAVHKNVECMPVEMRERTGSSVAYEELRQNDARAVENRRGRTFAAKLRLGV